MGDCNMAVAIVVVLKRVEGGGWIWEEEGKLSDELNFLEVSRCLFAMVDSD